MGNTSYLDITSSFLNLSYHVKRDYFVVSFTWLLVFLLAIDVDDLRQGIIQPEGKLLMLYIFDKLFSRCAC
jgi:hypothetical protein